jgi:hypothetical protein
MDEQSEHDTGCRRFATRVLPVIAQVAEIVAACAAVGTLIRIIVRG